jgi:hypothetical protein
VTTEDEEDDVRGMTVRELITELQESFDGDDVVFISSDGIREGFNSAQVVYADHVHVQVDDGPKQVCCLLRTHE